jgi:hypothetical protein
VYFNYGGKIMPTFNGIVQISYGDLRDESYPPFEGISVVKGNGRGDTNIFCGVVPFANKVRELEARIDSGQMESRDWKCRYDGHFRGWLDAHYIYHWGFLTVRIGPTSYQEWREDYNRSEEEVAVLQERGRTEHGDWGFYLSQGLGVAALTLTADGQVVVGIRKSDSYDGAIHGAAGWMKFNKDFMNHEVRREKAVHPHLDIIRKLEEELGVSERNIIPSYEDGVNVACNKALVGLVAHPKTLEADFVYAVPTKMEGAYFTSGAWKRAVNAREHRDLVVLANPDEIGRLLEEGKIPGSEMKQYEIFPSTHYGLDILAKNWDAFGPRR